MSRRRKPGPSTCSTARAADAASSGFASRASNAPAPCPSPESSRAVASETSTSPGRSSALERRTSATVSTAVTGIGPIGESRVRDEVSRRACPS